MKDQALLHLMSMLHFELVILCNGDIIIKTILLLQPQAQPAVAPQDPKPAKTDYNGTPYSLIVEALLARWGIFGEPAEGNRNTTLYRLVRELRYICDFNAACILAVTPDWGLPAEERRQTVNSALQSPRGTHLPDDLKAVLGQLGDEVSHETGGETPELNPMPEKLPFLLAYFVQRYRLNWRCVLMASLPILGNLLSRLRSQYLDGQAHMDCSQETAAKVDMAVQKLLDDAYADAKQILVDNRALLDEISEFLLTKETITGEELMAFIHPEKPETPETEE